MEKQQTTRHTDVNTNISKHEAVNARSLSQALERFVTHNEYSKLRTESLSFETTPPTGVTNQAIGDVEFKTTRKFSRSRNAEASGHQFQFSNSGDMFTNAGHTSTRQIQFKSNATIAHSPPRTPFNEAGTESILSRGLSRSDVMRNFEMRGDDWSSGSDSNLESPATSCGTFVQSSKIGYSGVTFVSGEQEDEDTIAWTGKMTTTQPAQLVIKQAPIKPQRNEERPSITTGHDVSMLPHVDSESFWLDDVWPWPWLDRSRKSVEYVGYRGGTFQGCLKQKKCLPPLLALTLKGYLDSMEPCLTRDQFGRLRKIANEFALCKADKLTEKLSNKLKSSPDWLIKGPKHDNVLSRQEQVLQNIPIVVPLYDDLWPAKSNSQVSRASELIILATEFYLLICHGRLKMGKGFKNESLCMHSFKKLFSTNRIPYQNKDEVESYFHTKSLTNVCSKHIVVMYKSMCFPLQVLDDKFKPVSTVDVSLEIYDIKKNGMTGGRKGLGLGILTATDRDTWYKCREKLICLDPQNLPCLKIIDHALFIVSLDNISVRKSALSHEAVFGQGCNRWYDKSLSFCVYENGVATCSANKACQDGWPVAVLLDYIHLRILEDQLKWDDDVIQVLWSQSQMASRSSHCNSDSDFKMLRKSLDSSYAFVYKTSDSLTLEERDFDFVIDQEINNEIDAAIARFNKLQENILFADFDFQIFSGGKVDLEAFAHLVFHLNFFRMYYRIPSMRSSVQTKQFHNGRCEMLLATTREADLWCRSMMDPNVDGKEKTKLFLAAAQKHMTLHHRCLKGQGCLRHMNALKLIAAELGDKVPPVLEVTDKFDVFVDSLGKGFLATKVVLPKKGCGYCVGYSLARGRFCGTVSSHADDHITSAVLFAASLRRTLDVHRQFFSQF